MTEQTKPEVQNPDLPPPPQDLKHGDKKIDPKIDPKAALLDRISDILREYREQESNIPINHPYWGLVNEYRGMK